MSFNSWPPAQLGAQHHSQVVAVFAQALFALWSCSFSHRPARSDGGFLIDQASKQASCTMKTDTEIISAGAPVKVEPRTERQKVEVFKDMMRKKEHPTATTDKKSRASLPQVSDESSDKVVGHL